MKTCIFAVLALLILSSGISAQGTYLENKDIQTIISNISKDLNGWTKDLPATSEKDKAINSAQVTPQVYNAYVTVHDGYLKYGKAFSSGQNYMTIIDSLTPELDPNNTQKNIRNPLETYITLTAIYLYSYETLQSIQGNMNNKEAIAPDKTVKTMLSRLSDMNGYIEERFNRYKAQSFNNVVRNYIRDNRSRLIETQEDALSKAYKKERDDLIKRSYESKQIIDNKLSELVERFNSKLIEVSTADKNNVMTLAKDTKDAEDKYNRIIDIKERTENMFDKAVTQYNNTKDDLNKAQEDVDNAKTEYESAKLISDASNTPEDLIVTQTNKRNYENAVKKHDATKIRLEALETKLKETKTDLETINANLKTAQEAFGTKKSIQLEKRQLNTNTTKQDSKDEEDIKNDLESLQITYDGNSSSLSLRTIGINGSTIKWRSSDRDIISVDNNIGVAVVTKTSEETPDVILTATISKKNAVPQTKQFVISFKKTVGTSVKDGTSTEEPAYSDEQIIQKELDEITMAYDGTSQRFVVETKTKNSYLPIIWSSDSLIITIDHYGIADVTRPSDGDKTVTLTATVTDGKTTKTRSFELIVIAKPEPVVEPVEKKGTIKSHNSNTTPTLKKNPHPTTKKKINQVDKNTKPGTADTSATDRYIRSDLSGLIVKYDHMSKSFTVPVKGDNGSTITWTAEPSGIIEIDNRTGLVTVKRDEYDHVITLTAKSSMGESTPQTKEFSKIVKSTKTRIGISGTCPNKQKEKCIIFDFTSSDGTIKVKLTFPAEEQTYDTFYVNDAPVQYLNVVRNWSTGEFNWSGMDKWGRSVTIYGNVEVPSVDRVSVGTDEIFIAL